MPAGKIPVTEFTIIGGSGEIIKLPGKFSPPGHIDKVSKGKGGVHERLIACV